MSAAEAIKEALKGVPQFVQEFVNLMASPRAYAAAGKVFAPSRFNQALGFLGVSLVVTLVLKAPMFPAQPSALPYLAADAVWKFAMVLIETAVITFVWRLLKGRGTAGQYLVANCFYFGVLTVLGHTIKLLGYAIEKRIEPPSSSDTLLLIFYAVTGGCLVLWMLACWCAYGDFNHAKIGRTLCALALVVILSVPALLLGALLRDALLGNIFPVKPSGPQAT
jgi:hypothetical protein